MWETPQWCCDTVCWDIYVSLANCRITARGYILASNTSSGFPKASESMNSVCWHSAHVGPKAIKLRLCGLTPPGEKVNSRYRGYHSRVAGFCGGLSGSTYNMNLCLSGCQPVNTWHLIGRRMCSVLQEVLSPRDAGDAGMQYMQKICFSHGHTTSSARLHPERHVFLRSGERLIHLVSKMLMHFVSWFVHLRHCWLTDYATLRYVRYRPGSVKRAPEQSTTRAGFSFNSLHK